MEPSAAAALEAIRRVAEEAVPLKGGDRRGSAAVRVPEGATHLAWLTGGGMLPAQVTAHYLG